MLDDISRRRPPSPSVMAARLVAVVGSVRSPGLVEWREGLIVADAISLAGGVIPPPRPEFARLTSSIVRGSMTSVDAQIRPLIDTSKPAIS
ncbi:MAG: hypothetical protein AMXMBFR57_31500 [Acidimicrobiia bacterium]